MMSKFDLLWLWTAELLTCKKYCLIRSACSGVCGLAYTPFSGNPASPGMSKRAMASEYISCWPCDFDEHLCGTIKEACEFDVNAIIFIKSNLSHFPS